MILISIITPVYNRQDCIKRAIDSVKYLQIPEDFDYEHIIINDGSTDNTEQTIKDNTDDRTTYITLEQNSGVNAARNAGIKNAQGDYTLFLDSDDELMSDALIKIKETLDNTNYEHKAYVFKTKDSKTQRLMSQVKIPDKKINYKQYLSGKYLQGEFITLVKKEVFDEMLFDEDRMAFEKFFWNKVNKKYGSFPSVHAIRIYHTDCDNRLCKKLTDPKNALKRYHDYKKYIETFEEDYRQFELKEQLEDLYVRLIIFGTIAGKRDEANHIAKSVGLKIKSFKSLSFLGKLPFIIILKILSRYA